MVFLGAVDYQALRIECIKRDQVRDSPISGVLYTSHELCNIVQARGIRITSRWCNWFIVIQQSMNHK